VRAQAAADFLLRLPVRRHPRGRSLDTGAPRGGTKARGRRATSARAADSRIALHEARPKARLGRRRYPARPQGKQKPLPVRRTDPASRPRSLPVSWNMMMLLVRNGDRTGSADGFRDPRQKRRRDRFQVRRKDLRGGRRAAEAEDRHQRAVAERLAVLGRNSLAGYGRSGALYGAAVGRPGRSWPLKLPVLTGGETRRALLGQGIAPPAYSEPIPRGGPATALAVCPRGWSGTREAFLGPRAARSGPRAVHPKLGSMDPGTRDRASSLQRAGRPVLRKAAVSPEKHIVYTFLGLGRGSRGRGGAGTRRLVERAAVPHRRHGRRFFLSSVYSGRGGGCIAHEGFARSGGGFFATARREE